MAVITIRPSSLPGYADCPRRTVARLLRREIEDAGYALRSMPPGIGAAIGTATHAGAATALRSIISSGEINTGEATDAAVESLELETADGVVWDDVSPTAPTSQKQVLRQYRRWAEDVAPLYAPEHVELRLEADMGVDVVISGQADVATGDVIRDLKTGRMQRAHGAQYGMYSLLWRANGHTINGVVEDYVPRAPITKVQPKAVSTTIDIIEAERSAAALAKRMVADITTFRSTGEPWSFVANPASMLCGEKWCSAWGTGFCRAHKGS